MATTNADDLLKEIADEEKQLQAKFAEDRKALFASRREDIVKRMEELAPTLVEYDRLQRALDALDGKPPRESKAKTRRRSTGGARGKRAVVPGLVLDEVTKSPGITVAEVAEKLDRDKTYLHVVVKKLIEAGDLTKDGTALHPVARTSTDDAAKAQQDAPKSEHTKKPAEKAQDAPETAEKAQEPKAADTSAKGDDKPKPPAKAQESKTPATAAKDAPAKPAAKSADKPKTGEKAAAKPATEKVTAAA